MKRLITIIALLIFCSFLALAAGGSEEQRGDGPLILASTSWTAAFAKEAGIEGEIISLAPSDYRHPPEYELLPSQVTLLADADYFIFGGYEGIAQRVLDGSLELGGSPLQITTVNSKKIIEESILKIATAFGSVETARRNIDGLHRKIDEVRGSIEAAGFGGTEVVCHAFLKDMVEDFGFKVVGVFGPAPPEAKQILELNQQGAALIIDNWHNDVGKLVSRNLEGLPVVSLINFPGHGETESLMDVIDYNFRQLQELFQQ